MDEIGNMHKKTAKSTLDPAGLHINKDKRTMAAPAPAPVDPGTSGMPDDESTKAAQRRKQAAMQQRGGRASTVLSTEERLGG